VKEAKIPKVTYCDFTHEMSRIGKSTDTESRIVVARDLRRVGRNALIGSNCSHL
jgi:hypothetical protein